MFLGKKKKSKKQEWSSNIPIFCSQVSILWYQWGNSSCNFGFLFFFKEHFCNQQWKTLLSPTICLPEGEVEGAAVNTGKSPVGRSIFKTWRWTPEVPSFFVVERSYIPSLSPPGPELGVPGWQPAGRGSAVDTPEEAWWWAPIPALQQRDQLGPGSQPREDRVRAGLWSVNYEVRWTMVSCGCDLHTFTILTWEMPWPLRTRLFRVLTV